MTDVRISCPSCAKTGEIEVSEDSMLSTSRGLLSINISKDVICPHSFVAYIDKNFCIRSYFLADFYVELPKIAPLGRIEEERINIDDVDLDLIVLNLPGILMTYILRSIFSKKKVVIISDETFLYNHILKFYRYITADTFNFEILLMSKNEYQENKKNYKDFIVLESIEILRNKKFIEPKKLKVEKQIVQNFLENFRITSSIIVLKNEIQKAFLLSKSIVDYINNNNEIKNINNEKKGKESILESLIDGVINREKNISKLILDHLIKTYKTKIQNTYLNFLLDIVKNYFEKDIHKIATTTSISVF